MTTKPLPPDVGHSLALALVASSTAPQLLLDGEHRIIAVSTSFCNVFDFEPGSVPGRPLAELGAGEWNVPQLFILLKATAAGHADIPAYELDLPQPAKITRRLVVNVHRLAYADPDQVLLLLSVADTTAAHLAEQIRVDLLREMDEIRLDKAILMQEIQHRVANSLQIIASVLLQSARRVQSDETRQHLQAAHQRVMSVAALQKHLARSTSDEVVLSTYFNGLCESIGASMIRDQKRIALTVDVDRTVVGSDVSISLGLIVTELVINALKHAFPNNRRGAIKVAYAASAGGFELSVSDNGVGMPVPQGTPGLGTNIVSALAHQLRAAVVIRPQVPGTMVSIIRSAPEAA
jgi:two-component sensor histidine kinase